MYTYQLRVVRKKFWGKSHHGGSETPLEKGQCDQLRVVHTPQSRDARAHKQVIPDTNSETYVRAYQLKDYN